MNKVGKTACVAAAGLWLLALFGGLWFAGVFSLGGKGRSHEAEEESETDKKQSQVWEVVFQGMKFTLPQKGKVYLHPSGCMNIRRDKRYLIQIELGEDTVDEMWESREQRRESLINDGYRMEKEAERLTGEGRDYVCYVVSLEKERGSDFDRSYFEVLFAPADEGRHLLAAIRFDGIDVDKLDETLREKIYEEAFIQTDEIFALVCPTDQMDDEEGTLWMEDVSIDPEQRYLSEDTIVYGEGQYRLSYRLPEHCMLTADTIAGKTYYEEDNQVYIHTNVVNFTWMTAKDMAESTAGRRLSRSLASGEVKVNGRIYYYYTYSIVEYEKNKASTDYYFEGYCDLEDGSIYYIYGHGEDYPEAVEAAYYLEWMDISVS